MMDQHERTLEVAIIGGGITGVTLGLGLLGRNVSFTIYERAGNFREIGAGIAFNPTAVRAMRRLNPLILEGFEKVVTRLESVEPYVFYVDGFTQPESFHDDDAASFRETAVFKRHLGDAGAEGCRRSDFLEEIVRFIPPQNVRFNKDLAWVDETRDGRARLTFEDGSSADADVGKSRIISVPRPGATRGEVCPLGSRFAYHTLPIVIGCDGIKSRLRRIMFGEDNPASHPGYSHRFCFRGVISTDSVRAILGDRYKRAARTIYSGRDAHLIT